MPSSRSWKSEQEGEQGMNKEIVHASGEMLAEHIPDWHWKVNPDVLNISSNCQCVLGQLGTAREMTADDAFVPNAYTTMVEKLSGIGGPFSIYHSQWATAHAFDKVIGQGTWADLNQLWKDEIQARRDDDIAQAAKEAADDPEPALA
jgi:hypothetical protein